MKAESYDQSVQYETGKVSFDRNVRIVPVDVSNDGVTDIIGNCENISQWRKIFNHMGGSFIVEE